MSILVATKVKSGEIWLPRFITQVEQLEGDIEKVVVMYGDSPDNSYTYLKHWRETSRHTVELYRDPYLPPDERHGAMLARVKREIQQLLKESTAEYYLNLDCDLVDIPRQTIPHLAAHDLDLVAGMVFTEGREAPHFFDTFIYRMEGARFHPYRPPGLYDKEPFPVDSVSTYYLAKREVELAGRYVNPYPHLPFCDDLRKKGYKVWVDPTIAAHHFDLERIGITHMPLPVAASQSQFIDYNRVTYTPEQVGAEEHTCRQNQYNLELARLSEPFLNSYAATKEWLDHRPLITACYKLYKDVEMLSYSIDSIYDYVDRILIAYGPVQLREKDYPYEAVETRLQQVVMERDYDDKVSLLGKRVWLSKEHIQRTLLKECTGRWMLYIDGDEVIDGMETLRRYVEANQNTWYLRPESFINFYGDYHHIAYSLNPQNPYYRYGMPHCFLINRDVPGLSFGFHTMAVDGYGVPLHSDHPANRHRRGVLEGVTVYHYGNAASRERLESKRDYYTRRGDATVYEDSFESCKLEPDMVLERFTGDHPGVMGGHPRMGLELIEVTGTKPCYEYRWLK